MPKDDATWLNFFYVAVAAISAYVFYLAIYTTGIHTGWVERYDQWYPAANNLAAVVLGGLTALWFRAGKQRHEYLLSAVGELRKVSWPTMLDTRRLTIIVCIVVGIFAVILAGFDYVWAKLLGLLIA